MPRHLIAIHCDYVTINWLVRSYLGRVSRGTDRYFSPEVLPTTEADQCTRTHLGKGHLGIHKATIAHDYMHPLSS
jgi:hypothetical protein